MHDPSAPPAAVPAAPAAAPVPTDLVLHQTSNRLEVTFSDGRSFSLPTEFLRVHSPSAEVRGHGPGEGTLQVGKRGVTITDIDPVGTYAVKLVFSDGHDTGIFSWALLYDYGSNQDTMWARYLQRLDAAKGSRDPER
ncbi:MAG: DUF971 domain-containing protein [Rhodocyclaceae bacterium]|jgi:DUF971 family protein|nr:DUF971 domain-containing protein [Rhodocyclaceae bacterium]MCE2981882.1 DUF971 domain-containing protein [Betaproteobacteria bacterium]MCA3075589.1 DUF971 domain-containing protein [Rhodocyclaceae bacterium]MCA3092057.1 DUF971 domain-containing protein [Rhodocyclaceae bacterium]MCA3095986.1 DUF971 domain-containing protein [Rhodocyclaceae bacterium]